MTFITVSTKTGDKGETGLANGQRLGKDDPVFGVIGDLDELNSWLGLVAARLGTEFRPHREFLYEIQDTLFYIGAELARSPKAQLQLAAVTKLEKLADEMQAAMADNWHTKFVLPGGTEIGGFLDVARTVGRRAERALVAYTRISPVPVSPILLQYVNRLSDYLYVLRCFVNQRLEYTEKLFEVKTAGKTKKK